MSNGRMRNASTTIPYYCVVNMQFAPLTVRQEKKKVAEIESEKWWVLYFHHDNYILYLYVGL